MQQQMSDLDRHKTRPTRRGGQDAPSMVTSSVRLSCETCSQRKVKCDRLVPCTNCRRSGILCVPVERRRMPRGKSGNVTARRVPRQLRNASGYQEKTSRSRMLPNIENDGAGRECESLSAVESQNHVDSAEMSSDRSAFGVSMSWTPDMTPIEQSREPLDFSVFEPDNVMNFETLLTRITCAENSFDSLTSCQGPRTDLWLRQHLLWTYISRIDPIVKILHYPSIHAYLSDGKPYLGYDLWHPAPAALASAICYAASCSLDEDKCLYTFNMTKEALISKYRKETEMALERVDFILTNDLTVLQAFVISLIANRLHDRSRRLWTMFSTAVRIAQALSLHTPNPCFPIKPFEREMRKRLWHAIAWLDIQTSLEYASEPIIQSKWVQSQPLLNVNDSDLGLDNDTTTSSGNTIRETSLFLLLSHAARSMRELNISDFCEPGFKDPRRRQQVVVNFQLHAAEVLVGLQPDRVDFHWYVKGVTEAIAVFLQLVALRPLQKNQEFVPLKVSKSQILELAIRSVDLRNNVYTDVRSQFWRWMEPLFFPWPALAIALSEICSCEDSSLVERFWPSIENGYRSFTALVIDSSRSKLWQSMETIMESARIRREGLLRIQSAGDTIHMDSIIEHQSSLQSDSMWELQGVPLSFPITIPVTRIQSPPASQATILSDHTIRISAPNEGEDTDFGLLHPNSDSLHHTAASADYEALLESIYGIGNPMMMLY